MPSWNDVLNEIRQAGSIHDVTRRKYLSDLYSFTNRNVIIYYSGWLQKSGLLRFGLGFEVNDADKNGLMAAIYKLDRTKGLDLILHTPGGDVSATESIVDYLRSMFGTDIRAIVPQIAMSAGTMISLACKEVVMGKHSSLGPIDPQIMGMAAHGILEEFNQAKTDVQANPHLIPLWQVIIAKYSPTLVGEAQKSMDWAQQMVKAWLKTGMFAGEADAQAKADAIVAELADHALTKSHARHITAAKARELGIKVTMLEDNQDLQEKVLSSHHACIHTLAETAAIKLIENHLGTAYIPVVNMNLPSGISNQP